MTEGSAVPTVEELREYLMRRKPLGWEWDGASVRPISVGDKRNHWTFCAKAHDVPMALRFINPAGPVKKRRWLSLGQEYRLLQWLDGAQTGGWMVAPRPYGLDRRGFRLPVLIQEFVPGVPLSKFKDEGRFTIEHIVEVSRLIGRLSNCQVPRSRFPTLWGRTERSYRPHIARAYDRLRRVEAAGRLDLNYWVDVLRGLAVRVAEVLDRFEPLLAASPSVFIFKGAHLGNTLWDADHCRFVDLEQVAWGDPTFTLARCLSSVPANRDRRLDPKYVAAASLAYQQEYSMLPIPNFSELLRARRLERELADAVWVIHEYVEQGRTGPAEQETNVAVRCDRVRELLAGYTARPPHP
ncbi:aminoglycoside phosphotransferase family protein [Candidatus Parcubacteria bacterium]|nr:aminoglycoside phosphotransferase family protein [Candidatus Parcubacteria bacterium]